MFEFYLALLCPRSGCGDLIGISQKLAGYVVLSSETAGHEQSRARTGLAWLTFSESDTDVTY